MDIVVHVEKFLQSLQLINVHGTVGLRTSGVLKILHPFICGFVRRVQHLSFSHIGAICLR